MNGPTMAIAAAMLLGGTAAAAAPPPSKVTVSEAPRGSVNIYRDDWGVAHVYATAEEDGFFGKGYAVAEDALTYVLQSYLASRGELAATFGRKPGKTPALAVADDMVVHDTYVRLGRFWDQAKVDYKKLPARIRRNLAAHTNGVEAYMRDHPEKVPSWWGNRRIDPVYQLALVSTLYMQSEAGWPQGVIDCKLPENQILPAARGGVDFKADFAAGVPYGTKRTNAGQSNGWMIGGSRTRSGNPIFTGDPHGGGRANKWEYRMQAGAIKEMGIVSMPLAYPTTGHTRWQAWALTSGGGDAGDCLRVKLDGTNAYRIDGKPRPILRRDYVIAVKGQASERIVTEHILVDGLMAPVVARTNGYAYAMVSAYLKDLHLWFLQMDAQLRAKTTAQMVAATDIRGLPAFNELTAGSDGGLFWVSGGRMMARGRGVNSLDVISYETAAVEPQGILAPAELVHDLDPPAGYAHNNNEMPDTTTPIDAPLAKDYFPYAYLVETRQTTLKLGDDVNFGRTDRIAHLLKSAYDVTFDDALTLALDTQVPWADRWTDALSLALIADHDRIAKLAPDVRAFASRAASFDGWGAATSKKHLAFILWREALATDPSVERIADKVETKKPLDADERRALVDAVVRAADALRRQRGTLDLAFGDQFRIAENGVSVPAQSVEAEFTSRYRGAQPLWLAHYGEPDAKGIREWVGGSWGTWVAEMGPRVRSMNMLQPGVSRDPSSPYSGNQISLIAERRLKPTYFYADELEGHVSAIKTIRR